MKKEYLIPALTLVTVMFCAYLLGMYFYRVFTVVPPAPVITHDQQGNQLPYQEQDQINKGKD